jgi:hypothetical protein
LTFYGALASVSSSCSLVKGSATAAAISKQYADQASGNMNWFTSAYGPTNAGTVVIVHPATILDADAFPPENSRVIGKSELQNLHTACIAFVTAVKDDLGNETKIKMSPSANGLLGDQLLQNFTVKPTKKKKAS